MSLDNVFTGKKVVQQIYLKNALIYQSKGWETLPSAPQVEWTKNYSGTGTGIVNNCAVDQDNNIYIAFQNFVYKISADGLLLWRKAFSGAQKICIDQDNNIYLAQLAYYNQSDNGKSPIINQIDTNGNLIKRLRAIDYIADSITGFTFDRNYLYIASQYSSQYQHLCKVDKGLQNSVDLNINDSIYNLVTSETSQYIFYSDGYNLYQIKKDDLKSSPISISSSHYMIQNMILDDLGNLIFYDGHIVFKYNIETKLVTKMPTLLESNNSTMCIDYQQNFYLIWAYSTSMVNLVKYSSDNTQIYNSFVIDTAFQGAATNGKLIADHNGNIYYIYLNSNTEVTVTKIINLVKKGN